MCHRQIQQVERPSKLDFSLPFNLLGQQHVAQNHILLFQLSCLYKHWELVKRTEFGAQ